MFECMHVEGSSICQPCMRCLDFNMSMRMLYGKAAVFNSLLLRRLVRHECCKEQSWLCR